MRPWASATRPVSKSRRMSSVWGLREDGARAPERGEALHRVLEALASCRAASRGAWPIATARSSAATVVRSKTLGSMLRNVSSSAWRLSVASSPKVVTSWRSEAVRCRPADVRVVELPRLRSRARPGRRLPSWAEVRRTMRRISAATPTAPSPAMSVCRPSRRVLMPCAAVPSRVSPRAPSRAPAAATRPAAPVWRSSFSNRSSWVSAWRVSARTRSARLRSPAPQPSFGFAPNAAAMRSSAQRQKSSICLQVSRSMTSRCPFPCPARTSSSRTRLRRTGFPGGV